MHDDAGDLHRHPRAILALQAHLHRSEAAVVQQRLDSQRPIGAAVGDFPVRPFQREDLILRIAGDHLHGPVRLQKPSIHIVERDPQRGEVVETAQFRLAEAQLFPCMFAGGHIGDVAVPDGAPVVHPARQRITLDPSHRAVRSDDAMLQVPGLQSLAGALHRLSHRVAIVLVRNPPQHGPIIHQRLGRQSVHAVSSRAHVKKLTLGLGGMPPLKDHSRNVLGYQGKPLACEAALLLRHLVLGDVELDAVHSQRLAVGGALEHSARAEHPTPLAVFAEKSMMPAKQVAAALHDLADAPIAMITIVRVTDFT